MNKSELIAALNKSSEVTLAHFQLSDSDLAKTYGEGKWTIRQILIHLADAESTLCSRLRGVISEERPLLLGFDQDAWVDVMYDQRDLEISKTVYQAMRALNLELIEKFHASHGERVGIHSYDGAKTLADIMGKISWHNDRHLAQIEQALAS